jgi:nucleoside 2-deoxyribosyltransferase
LFAIKTWELEREGNIVLGCTLLPMWYCNVTDHFGEATGTKEQCDELHLRKIDLADEVLVLNVDGYIGESTRNEINYAIRQGKPIHYLEDNSNAN